jgi:hypothetical protein
MPRSPFLVITLVTLAPLPATVLGQDAAIEAASEPEPADAKPADDTVVTAPPEPESARPSGAPVAEAPPEVATEQAGDEVKKPPIVTVRLGEGLTVKSADGDYSIQIRARAQIRFTALTDSPGNDDASVGFSVRRMRLLFLGNLFDEHWLYYIQLGFSNLDMEPDLRIPLRDAYMTSTHLRDLNVRFGQMKVPHDRQRVISSSALQFTDRSIATAEFNLDRDVGIQALSTDIAGRGGRFGYNIGIFGGDGRNRLPTNAGLLYAARVQFLPMGPFDDFTEGDLTRSADPHLAIALSGAFNQDSVRARSTFTETFQLGSYDYVHFASDFSFKWSGAFAPRPVLSARRRRYSGAERHHRRRARHRDLALGNRLLPPGRLYVYGPPRGRRALGRDSAPSPPDRHKGYPGDRRGRRGPELVSHGPQLQVPG